MLYLSHPSACKVVSDENTTDKEEFSSQSLKKMQKRKSLELLMLLGEGEKNA